MRIFKIFLISIVWVSAMSILSGCGSDDGPSTQIIDMQINQTYSILSTDQIHPVSADPEIKITYQLDSGARQATLISGSAQIIRSN